MLAPTRETRFVESSFEAPTGTAYFDINSSGPADLEGRVVVHEYSGDGWKVTSTYRCMSTAVTDIERYNEIARELYQP